MKKKYKRIYQMKNIKQNLKILVDIICNDSDCVYVLKWSEKHTESCKYKQNENIYSVMYEQEERAKAIAFDLAFGIRTTKDFCLYVPRCNCENICSDFIDSVTIVVDHKKISDHKKVRILYVGYMEITVKNFYLNSD